MRAARFGWSVLSWVVLLLLVAVLALGVIGPRLLGGQAWTVLTGSMNPRYPPGTLVVTRPVAPAELGVGDVITYQLESGRPAVVTHRIVAVGTNARGETVFTTRGDANEAADPRPVQVGQVRGELAYAVPVLGRVNALLTPDHRVWVVAAGAVSLVGYALRMFVGVAQDRRLARRRRAAATDATAAGPPTPSAPGPVLAPVPALEEVTP
ncbi:hypothetical protein GCM10022197_24120 [Microlunatus spumicola]|uniref:Signal peptidase I n=1 Tax=Microlunatus spumicola TaxID=81499 RepID=A0ABP6XHA8_9ACTN